MPKIRQNIDPLPINRTAKAVLTEVCELYEHGRRRCCDAQNAHFVERLGGSERTMTRALAELERLGLVEVAGQGKARRIAPTLALRACYTAPTPAGRREAVASLGLTNYSSGAATTSRQPRQSGEVGEQPNLDKSGAEHSQKWLSNLDKNGSEPSQKWFFTPYSGNLHNEQVTINNGQKLSVSERAQFKKRIAELEHEVTRLKSLLADLPAVALATPPTQHTGYRDFSAGWPAQLHPPFPSAEFQQAWSRWAAYRAEIEKPFQGHVGESQDLERLGRLAAGDQGRALKIISDSISGGWRTLNINDRITRPPVGGPPPPPPQRAAASPSSKPFPR